MFWSHNCVNNMRTDTDAVYTFGLEYLSGGHTVNVDVKSEAPVHYFWLRDITLKY